MKAYLLAAALAMVAAPASAAIWYSPDLSNGTCETLEQFFPNLGIHAPSDFYEALIRDGYPVTEDKMHYQDGTLEAVAFYVEDKGQPVFVTMWADMDDCQQFLLKAEKQPDTAQQPPPGMTPDSNGSVQY